MLQSFMTKLRYRKKETVEDIKKSCSLMYGAQQVFILFIIIVGGMILIARR